VLGVLPGVIGTIQATETIKLILGGGETLAGRLLLYDAWRMRFRELKLRRSPECPACGDAPTIRELIDYHQFCGVPAAASQPSALRPDQETTVEALKQQTDRGDTVFILDVREPQEFQICRIPGSTLVPLGQLPSRVAEVVDAAAGAALVVHCKSGARSAKAVRLLEERGVAAKNLKGGILAWIDRVDPTLKRY
jgi:adenylyltransferase/sulfurtransferase